MKKKTVSARAAETILSSDVKITIGKDKYSMPRPTLRTMIEASREISLLPEFKVEKGKEASCAISWARHSGRIGRIIAILLVGVKKRCFLSIYYNYKIKRLSEKILDTYSPSELSLALTTIFSSLEIQDFFVVTTSLNEINLTKKTAGVD